ncbi:MAG: TIGR04282 family arsenosugar biosynthesis glycosyltransferase [Phycisphaerae bacterium]|nr:TIGR04282 family arsenosugar biosynthesis glycosyltransferase [Phycisphaerae bacterium]
MFVKSPTTGQVKTRLAAEIGEDAAVRLYRCFVEDLISMVEKLDTSLRICFYPPETKSLFLQWLGEQHGYIPQTGDDLGERLKNAFVDAFEQGFSKVVAIGSDSPDLPASFLRQAFEELDFNDAVVGPSSDGGYYLIGFSADSFAPEAFDGIAWSTSAVLGQTRMKLKMHGLGVHLLPQWHDVDTRSDLDGLVTRTGNRPLSSSKTFDLIRRSDGRMPQS